MGVGRARPADTCVLRRRPVTHNITCRLFAASALTTLIGYVFFPRSGPWLGLSLFPLCVDGAAPAGDGGHLHAQGIKGCAARFRKIFADPATKSYVAACILLTLVFGVGFRAWQMEGFMADDLNQLPHYQGTERRIVLIDTRFSFYGGGSGAERPLAARQ